MVERLAQWTTRQFQNLRTRSTVEAATESARDAPLQLLGIGLLFAVLINTLVTSLLSGLDDHGLGVRLLFFAVAVLAIRIDTLLKALHESRVGWLFRS
jgi:hypothetical protein